MPLTTHMNLTKLPTGPVDWVAAQNANMAILEQGRTVKLVADVTLAKGEAFYIKSDGEAALATPDTEIHGIWQSTSTPSGNTGFGQTAGIITSGSWTPGALIYVTTGGALTATVTSRLVGFALSATVIYIQPESRGALIKYRTVTGITAFATGGQGSATQLTASVNVVTVCATAQDSVKLPAAAEGLEVKVINVGNTSCDVFPSSGDALNALAVNLAEALAADTGVTYQAIDATTWITV